jgi:hypothetical protein
MQIYITDLSETEPIFWKALNPDPGCALKYRFAPDFFCMVLLINFVNVDQIQI